MRETFKSNFIVEDKTMVSLSVYNVGLQKCESGYQWGPGIRDHFLIHHIVSGNGYFEVDGQTYFLSAGDSFLVYPYTQVTYRADTANPWEYYWVGFSGTDASSLLHATEFRKESPVIHHGTENGEIKRLLLDIFRARGNCLENSVCMTGCLYTALAYFIRTAKKTTKSSDPYATYAQKGIEYITANYSYQITIEDIADYAGISRSHLFRAFRLHLLKSPKEYLSEYRINQACILLRQSGLSILAIAKSVGFENNLYFSKAFHKAKGMTPTEYARKYSGS